MSRVYTIEFSGVSVTAVQDLLSIYTGGTIAAQLHAIQIGQITGTTVANLAISLKRLTGTITDGTGGTAVTPAPLDPGNAAATATARANDTTQATGTVTTLMADVFNTVNGYLLQFAPDDRPIVGLSSALILSLNTAPGAAMTMSGTLTFEELF